MFLANKLKHRIQIQTVEQTANSETGNLDRTYTTILRIWSAIEEDKLQRYINVTRGVQTESSKSPFIFIVRRDAIKGLGAQFASAFDISIKSMSDINQIKIEYFLLHEQGSQIKGIRYIIKGIIPDLNKKEILKIYADQLEEVGTGWPM